METSDPPLPPPWHPRAWPTLTVHTVRGCLEDRILRMGAAVAFFALLSLPPTLLAVFGSVGYLADLIGPRAAAGIRDGILDTLTPLLTAQTLGNVRNMLDTFLTEGRSGVVSLGVVLALWSASRATNVLIETVNIAYDQPETRSGTRRRLVAFGITFLGALGTVVVIPLMVAGPRLGEFVGRPLGMGELFAAAWRVLYWPAVALLGIVTLAGIYHTALARTTSWRRDLPGAVLAAVLWLAGSAGLRVYFAVAAAEDDPAYGPLGAPVAVLLWLYMTSVVVLAGAELNAEIEKLWPSEEAEEAGGPDEAPAAGEPVETIPKG